MFNLDDDVDYVCVEAFSGGTHPYRVMWPNNQTGQYCEFNGKGIYGGHNFKRIYNKNSDCVGVELSDDALKSVGLKVGDRLYCKKDISGSFDFRTKKVDP